MNDTTSVTPQEAVRVADEIAAEMGGGSVGTTTMSCDVICIGVFFDGTFNSRDHVGMPDINWHTNVDFLEAIYAEEVPDIAIYKGQPRKFIYGKQYVRGIAVREDGSTDTIAGGARGLGDEGVSARVLETIEAVNAQIRQLAAGKQVCDIVLDVFGFSRGAAAARFFANQVQAWAVGGEYGGATVRFLGIFDTVSSIYFPGQMVGLSDLPLTTSNLRDTEVCHIIAADEIRVNFPSTRAYGTEIYMVGSHSDIGGGRYEPGISSGGTYDYSPYVERGLHDWIIEKWGVAGDRRTYAANDQGDNLSGPGIPSQLTRGGDRAMFTWNSEHGLQNVSLRIMFDEAKKAGVPLPPEVPNRINDQDVSLHGDLQQYYSFFKEYGQCSDPDFENLIRRRYAQFSGQNDPVGAMAVSTTGCELDRYMAVIFDR
jgi:hypothetical protein